MCQNEVVEDLRQGSRPWRRLAALAWIRRSIFFNCMGWMDWSGWFCAASSGARRFCSFFATIESTLVGLEACGGAHYWARELTRLGHSVRLIAPQYVRPYVKRGKNDAADAEAIWQSRRLARIPRVGPVIASLLAMKGKRCGDPTFCLGALSAILLISGRCPGSAPVRQILRLEERRISGSS